MHFSLVLVNTKVGFVLFSSIPNIVVLTSRLHFVSSGGLQLIGSKFSFLVTLFSCFRFVLLNNLRWRKKKLRCLIIFLFSNFILQPLASMENPRKCACCLLQFLVEKTETRSNCRREKWIQPKLCAVSSFALLRSVLDSSWPLVWGRLRMCPFWTLRGGDAC